MRALFDRIEPLVTSRLVIDNHFETRLLEPDLWDGGSVSGDEIPIGGDTSRTFCCVASLSWKNDISVLIRARTTGARFARMPRLEEGCV